MSQPTVREVAALAGVSPMTVSRTLGGGAAVRPELRARVLEAVAVLGYHRNEAARSLRPGHRSGLIGVAITNLSNPYYGQFAQGVEEVAANHGRRILLGNTGEEPEREQQLLADFIGRQVEGLIVVPAGGDPSHFAPDLLQNTPLVLASREVVGAAADQVLLDDVGGARLGTLTLLEAGHRHIAFLGNATSIVTGRRRYEGFCRALAEFGIEPDERLVRRGQQDVGAARLAMKYLLDLQEPPTAVFAANNRNAIGALEEIGARVAGRVIRKMPPIVSFDNFELASLMPVPVTIIDHDPRELGRVAAGLLFRRLTGIEIADGFVQLEMPTRLHTASAN